MPTYEYECKSCGHNFDAFQSMSEMPLTDCPECGKELRRLINGGSGVIFKGSGFYVNDKNKENTKASGRNKSEGTNTGSSDSKSSDTSGRGEAKSPCKACAASVEKGGSCPVSEKAAG
ncbi:MAG: zinc ribbon domain-containing protein [Treponema sp.]|jgi:putative FmdB family regulatory protein|nr:zinc ribbon domain-containing protein [Treponema sp.]